MYQKPELHTTRDWIERQRRYWDRISDGYDQIYSTSWSLYENSLVQHALARILSRLGSSATVLEFGCGTGLGYRLMAPVCANLRYTGIDVSAAMLDVFRSRTVANVELINAPLESMLPRQFTNVDLAVAIFTGGSYIDLELEELLSLLSRWLRPNRGYMYISFLNRTSLRYMHKWAFQSRIEYGSRGIHAGTVPARRYAKSDLMRACNLLNLHGRVHSLGPFAGLLEKPIIQPLNSALRSATLFTHTIELVATQAR